MISNVVVILSTQPAVRDIEFECYFSLVWFGMVIIIEMFHVLFVIMVYLTEEWRRKPAAESQLQGSGTR